MALLLAAHQFTEVYGHNPSHLSQRYVTCCYSQYCCVGVSRVSHSSLIASGYRIDPARRAIAHSICFGSDYYYPTVPKAKDAGTAEIEAHSEREPSSDTMIVVAANGGGIQASAWTARVLTGLEEACQPDQLDCDQDFGKSIRLISSVSGGSVGTMYFMNEYEEDGTLPDNKKKSCKLLLLEPKDQA